jgi:hypothetical protein
LHLSIKQLSTAHLNMPVLICLVFFARHAASLASEQALDIVCHLSKAQSENLTGSRPHVEHLTKPETIKKCYLVDTLDRLASQL